MQNFWQIEVHVTFENNLSNAPASTTKFSKARCGVGILG